MCALMASQTAAVGKLRATHIALKRPLARVHHRVRAKMSQTGKLLATLRAVERAFSKKGLFNGVVLLFRVIVFLTALFSLLLVGVPRKNLIRVKSIHSLTEGAISPKNEQTNK